MTSLPPLSVTVSTKRRACVLDTQLALSRFGPLLAFRLCEEFDLWLVPELWHLLDNVEVYSRSPGGQFSGGPAAAGAGWRVWELARLEKDLAGLNVFWMGDEKCESLLPKSADAHLVHRFRSLDQTLQHSARTRPASEARQGTGYDFFLECCRQTVSLAAALTPYRGFILAHQPPPGTGEAEHEPPLCTALKGLGIQCFPVHRERRTRLEREYLLPILARTGISELLWAGLHLAVVHLVAPNALIIPVSLGEEELAAQEMASPAGEPLPGRLNWWEGAMGFWYPLRFD